MGLVEKADGISGPPRIVTTPVYAYPSGIRGEGRGGGPPSFVKFRWRASAGKKNGSVAMRYEGLRLRRYRRDPTVVRAENVPRQRLRPSVAWRKRRGRRPARRRCGARRRRRSERRSNDYADLPIRCWGTEVRPRVCCGFPRSCEFPKLHFARSRRDVLRELVWADLLWAGLLLADLRTQDACPGPNLPWSNFFPAPVGLSAWAGSCS